MSYYFTDHILAPCPGGTGPAATVLHGTFRGRFVAITITVRGSAWICHPSTSGDEWHKRNRHGSAEIAIWEGRLPCRRIRKAAKMALRAWLNP